MKKLLLLMMLCAATVLAADEDPARWVDPFVGTQNMGHTFPGATVPFGMVQLSPDTRRVTMYDADGKYTGQAYPYCSGYQYEDATITGFSHTHFSGTGHSDLGDISLMPVSGRRAMADPANWTATFSHADEIAEPGYYSVRLAEPKIGVELSATTRVGLHRYSFAETDTAALVLDLTANIYDYEGKNVWSFVRVENDHLVTGYRQTTGWARTRTVYFAMEFDRPIAAYGLERMEATPYRGFYRRFDESHDFPERAGREIRGWFDFGSGGELNVKVALSNTSTAGALENLRAEAPGWDFEAARAAARQQWNDELGRIEVETMTDDQRSVFATAFYHTLLSPIVYEDVDGLYRGLDQNLHASDGFTNYTIFSLWDTYRALHPWFTLVEPARNRDMIESMLAHFDQSVHPMLPIWSHYANENWCMIGYHGVPVIVDAIMKGAEVDPDRALDACIATASVPYFDGVGEYRELGWVPDEIGASSVSQTVEMAYDDWCIARLAEKASRPDVVGEYDRRARSYRNVFDEEIGFMRPRKRDGSWREPFDTMSTHGQGFIEGNAWTYSLFVPQDPADLVRLLGGPAKAGDYLDELFTMQLDDEHIAGTEDITRDGIIGNYVHGNEPGHHVAYLYGWTDRPWMTQARVRHILDTMYGTGPTGLCGNDDAGQMSAWYLFSALGFYPLCPGSPRYEIGSPLVKSATLHLENGRTLAIRAENQSPQNVYVQAVRVDGKRIDRPYLTHAELADGGEVVFVMGSEPAPENMNRR